MPKHKLPCLTDIKDLVGTKVLLRSSLNVPVENGEILNQFRLLRGLATVNYLRENGARVILVGHIGREKHETLEPVYKELHTSLDLRFTGDVAGNDSRNMVDEMADGDVVLLENVRSDPRETKNDPEFARQLASLADIYVNDAFADSHRSHASIVGVPQFLPSYIGLNFKNEYEELRNARDPKHPSLFILGGAKFDTKIPLVEKFLDFYDHIFIGGALAHDFFVAKGFEVGTSLVSGADVTSNGLIENKKILLPVDVTIASDSGIRVSTPDDVAAHERIVDAGPKTVEALAAHINTAKTVLWNGPLGDYEHGFGKQTEALAKLVAAAPGNSVIGGGDTIAAISSLNLQEHFNFLSTAGGAMLTFLEHGMLPGIEAILKSKQ